MSGLSKEEFEKYKELDRRHDKGRLGALEGQTYLELYDYLSPQQKGAMHRLWKQRGEYEYDAEIRSGTPEGGYA